MSKRRLAAFVALLAASMPLLGRAQYATAPPALLLPPPPVNTGPPPAMVPYGQAPLMAQAPLPPAGWQPVPAPPMPTPPPPPPAPEFLAAPPVETEPIVGPELIAPCCPPPKLWEGSLEFGLNGSSGNSEVFNFRLGAKGKRTTPENELSLSLLYVKNTQDGEEVANRAFLEGRNEWLQPDSPWTRFVHGTGEYDEFRAFDFRIAMDAGWGYAIVKNPATTLIGRFGPGFSHEIGGPDDSIVPEAVLGAEFEHKLSDSQKLTASGTWYPDLSDLGEYRCNSKAGWEVVINPAWNLSMQLAVLNRYDSTPNGAKPNDLDYSALLLWSF
jgi:putative salt-induced outer membrane protein YdiY